MVMTVALAERHVPEASAPQRLLQHDSCICVAPKQTLQLTADMQERRRLCLQSRWPPHDTTRGSHSRLQAAGTGLVSRKAAFAIRPVHLVMASLPRGAPPMQRLRGSYQRTKRSQNKDRVSLPSWVNTEQACESAGHPVPGTGRCRWWCLHTRRMNCKSSGCRSMMLALITSSMAFQSTTSLPAGVL